MDNLLQETLGSPQWAVPAAASLQQSSSMAQGCRWVGGGGSPLWQGSTQQWQKTAAMQAVSMAGPFESQQGEPALLHGQGGTKAVIEAPMMT